MCALILEADLEMTEEWKWMGATVSDPSRLFNSSVEGNTRRPKDINEVEKVDAGGSRRS